MAIDGKYRQKHAAILRDTRPMIVRIADTLKKPTHAATGFFFGAYMIHVDPWFLAFGDVVLVIGLLYFWWLVSLPQYLPFKLPMGAKRKDRKGKKAEGILFLGNLDKTNEEVWFTNSDARTHLLYLGTTGAGKTEGLKSMVTNALTWGSGFVYVDGKADTDLWSSLSSLVRRFGRDDDLLVLNYMTGNSDVKAPSHTMNPFSSGSASYLTNMLVELMPDAEGDNAMWKERAVSLASAMMPVLTYKRDNQDMPLSVRTIRDNLSLNSVVKVARDQTVPEGLRVGLKGYLDTLPGFVGDAYDDNGQVKPPGPGSPAIDTTTASQQHGYLAMQFTRALQSLGDDYGYIFDTQAADVDMSDVVLQRRILIVLIPALEKSGDEIANLGKIVASTMKGMMGAALGSTIEGSRETVIDNKSTNSATPFMTVFDEVGYYTAKGMAVMAAQARSLGFCLVFSGQDLPAMKKRVKEEANSIVANCNIKIFGKLEDPSDTKEFFEKTVGTIFVTEVKSFQAGTGSRNYLDNKQASIESRARENYDNLRSYTEGQATVAFGEEVASCRMFYSNPGHAKAMRVTRYMALPPLDEEIIKHAGAITKLRDRLVNKSWTAMAAEAPAAQTSEIEALRKGFAIGDKPGVSPIDAGIAALIEVYGLTNPIESAPIDQQASGGAAPDVMARKVDPPISSEPVQAAPQTPPLFTPPLSSPPPVNAGEPATAQKSSNPMGFFKAPGSVAPPTELPQQSQQPPQQTPVIQPSPVMPLATPIAEEALAPVAVPLSSPALPKLPKEIQDIIDEAAQNAKKVLIKDE